MAPRNLTMADSVRPTDLLAGYDAYLVYSDGEFRTASQVKAMFPESRILSMTVLGGHAIADGCDRETGDLSADSAASWAAWRLASGAWRPVIYASISEMTGVLQALASHHVNPDSVRLLSAHYSIGQHICGPSTCPEGKQVGRAMDGTQWTDQASGHMHSHIDASWLLPNFFDKTTISWEDELMASIPVTKLNDTGQAVRNWQGVLVAHGFDLGSSGQFRDGVDGKFGEKTHEATVAFQTSKGLKIDGQVGQNTLTAALLV